MDKVRELRIGSTLWPTPARLVNLHDFKSNKLNIESSDEKDIIFHKIKYDNGGFYFKIDNLEGYFNFVDNIGTLSLVFTDNNQKSEYDQNSNEILRSINKKYDKLKSYTNIKLFENELAMRPIFKINLITLVIRSIIKKKKKILSSSFTKSLFI